MSKQHIVDQLTQNIELQLQTMQEAARTSHEASTGEEGKAEGKYDTRGLEASYLADAQAEQCQTLQRSLHIFQSLTLDEFSSDEAVQGGALVETAINGEICYYLLTPCAGGITIEHEGFDLITISPEAPLYQSLIGCRMGESIEQPALIILDIS